MLRILLVMVLACSPAWAEVFQVRYSAEAPPQSSDPPWSVDGDAKVKADGGVLHAETTTAGTWWMRRDWLANPGQGFYVWLRLRLLTYTGNREVAGCTLKVADGEHAMIVLFRPDGIKVFDRPYEVKFDTTDKFHDYRIGVSGTDFFIEVDGKTVIEEKGRFTQVFAQGENCIQFGDLSQAAGATWEMKTLAYSCGKSKNAPPVFKSEGDVEKSLKEGEDLSLDFSATDEEGDDLRWSAEGLPAGATLDEKTGQLKWSVPFGAAGKHSFTVRVTDGDRAAERLVKVTVEHVNRPPAIVQPKKEEGTYPPDAVIMFNVRADDPDGEPLQYRVEGLPDGAKFDATTHLFQWTPRKDQVGKFVVKFVVTDGAMEASRTFTFHIEKP